MMFRFSFWFVCAGFLLLYSICEQQSSTSDRLNEILHRKLEKLHEKEGKKKSRPHHHRPGSPVKHTKDQLSTNYGNDLPSFAFDYSEYFVNAVITSSSIEKEQYLTMTLLGHHSIYEDFPFDALSTDEEAISSWNQALKLWKKEDIGRHRFSQKRFACVITSSLNVNHPYTSQISWLEVDREQELPGLTNASRSNLNHNFEIIHCKMPLTRFPSSAASSSSSSSTVSSSTSLSSIKYLVDIIVHDSTPFPSINSYSNGSSKVIFSFSISENKSYVGFPYQQPSSISTPPLELSIHQGRTLISSFRKSFVPRTESMIFLALFFLFHSFLLMYSSLLFMNRSINEFKQNKR
jgi:hypothetical protein